MKFTDALKVAYQVPWSYANTFEIFIAWNYSLLHNNKTLNVPKYYNDFAKGGNVIDWGENDQEYLSLHVVNFETPQLSNSELSSYTGNRWARANGQEQQYTFSFTVRDSDQLRFYKIFTAQYREQAFRYFDDYAFNIFISKDPDYYDKYFLVDSGDSERSVQAEPLMSLKRCAIQSISGLSFSHESNNQIVQFTVNCCANDIEIYDQGARSMYKHTGNFSSYNKEFNN